MNQMNTEIMTFLKDFASEYEQRERGLHKLLEKQSVRLEVLEKDLETTRKNYSEIMENSRLLKTYCDHISNNQSKIMTQLHDLSNEQDSTRNIGREPDGGNFLDEIGQDMESDEGGSYSP